MAKLHMSRVLTGEDILSVTNPTPFEIPELNGIVYLRSLPAGRVLDYSERSKDDKTYQALLELIAAAVVDEHGNPLFNESQIGRLRDMSVSIFNRLSNKVLEVANLASVGEKEGEG